jgi:hypothetical protein
VFRSRCGRTLTEVCRSSSPKRSDWSSVYSSQQAGLIARLPAHNSRFHGYPDKSFKGRIFWCPGHGRWCFMCSKTAHCKVPIPTHKHSPTYRARAHKIDPDRLRNKRSRCAHDSVPTYATSCTFHSFCKNETDVQALCPGERCYKGGKCARSPAPTPTHKHHSSSGTRPALSLPANHCRGIERGPRLRCFEHGAYITAHRSRCIASRSERASAPINPCSCMGEAWANHGSQL